MDTSKKHSKEENKRKAQNFGFISKLLSDGEIPVKEVNVLAALISLKGTQVYWLLKVNDGKRAYK